MGPHVRLANLSQTDLPTKQVSVHDWVHSQSRNGLLQSCMTLTQNGNCREQGLLLLQALPELLLDKMGITHEQLSAVTCANSEVFSVLSGRGGSGKSTVLTFALACKLVLSWREHKAMPRAVGAGPTTHSACLFALQVCLERKEQDPGVPSACRDTFQLAILPHSPTHPCSAAVPYQEP